MRTAREKLSLAEFARDLRGRRVAIVYSHSFGVPLEAGWYHRWNTRVIAMFSQAIEHCGAVPVFFDLDQWISFCAAPTGDVDFVVNLNAGNRSLDQWAIAPALALWLGIPVFPCSGFTVMLGEAKDVAKRVARDCGWRTARGPEDGLDIRCDVIRKPRTFGSSVGLERLKMADIAESQDDYIVEEFVRGYDATVVTFHSAVSRRLECQGAQVVIPDTSDSADWVYDSFEKRNPGKRTKVAFSICPVDSELACKAEALTHSLGGRFVSRVDVRVTSKPSAATPIRFEDCVFIEINPMPTIGPTNSVTELAARYIERLSDHEELAWISELTADRIERGAIYILSCGLQVVSSR